MLLLFAIGSMAPACFCSFIIGNSLSTMLALPKARIPITLAGAAVGIGIAMTGAPAYLEPIFGLIGASFGPVIGAMIADYYLNGGKWPGPREGINWAGYGAWLLGFLVGISNNPVVTQLLGFEILAGWQPTGVYSLIVGLVAYVLLARFVGLPARLEGAVRTIGPEGKA
jgi:cytosine permease